MCAARLLAGVAAALALTMATGGCVERRSLHDGATTGDASVAVDGGSPEASGGAEAPIAFDGSVGNDAKADAVVLDGARETDAFPRLDAQSAATSDGRDGLADAPAVVADGNAGSVAPDGGSRGPELAAPDVPPDDVANDTTGPEVVRSDAIADVVVPRDLPPPDLPNPCSPNPCTHGSCTASGTGFKCACSAGWGGTTCETGSCTGMTCPSTTTCRVPSKNAIAVCYPTSCVGSSGLCMAENSDGSGDAVLISGRNTTFADLGGADWRNRARYFGYLDESHSSCVCVFPQTDEAGTPLVITVGQVKTKSSGFGQSNSWNNPPACDCP